MLAMSIAAVGGVTLAARPPSTRWIGKPSLRMDAYQMTDRTVSYLLFSSFVTVYPPPASSASNFTLSPTFTCLSMAGSLTR
jgi:hypothetical protein